MKNLVVAVCGDNSFHKIWNKSNPNFDLFIVYYGNNQNKYEKDGKYYDVSKGTKFLILQDVVLRNRHIFDQYDAIFVPDDDLYMETDDINRFFNLFHQYKLEIAQPSIVGYISLPITANVNFSILRYTNYVEIMCPCFSKNAFNLCQSSFSENKTNWGIEFMWNEALGFPKDKIAIVDSIIAIHTRPCFYGDTYQNNGNNFDFAMQEAKELFNKYNYKEERVVYSTIHQNMEEFYNARSEDKFIPNCKYFKSMLKSMKLTMIGI